MKKIKVLLGALAIAVTGLLGFLAPASANAASSLPCGFNAEDWRNLSYLVTWTPPGQPGRSVDATFYVGGITSITNDQGAIFPGTWDTNRYYPGLGRTAMRFGADGVDGLHVDHYVQSASCDDFGVSQFTATRVVTLRSGSTVTYRTVGLRR
ncbi:hypothetical protein [Lentzea sp. HUAS12]|uniref:hypothetical protein n=1 Tax=Lentzea sp. HUAS12 TaxID=2951806 RepID=UPI00209C7444|nr:hypothetical protein [Lentzea sp. HUAS12]USX56386.1 hypothetical protein ND450_20480 [Lentzea sp. HUAS12]